MSPIDLDRSNSYRHQIADILIMKKYYITNFFICIYIFSFFLFGLYKRVTCPCALKYRAVSTN